MVPMLDSIEDLFEWIDVQVVANAWRSIMEVTCAILIWVLWTYENPCTCFWECEVQEGVDV